MSAATAFLEQNTVFAADLTEDDLATIELYAEHHAGGLYVLARLLDDDRTIFVKTHDDWAEEDSIVVHIYDNEEGDEGDLDAVELFTSGHAALDRFLRINIHEVKWGTYEPYEEES